MKIVDSHLQYTFDDYTICPTGGTRKRPLRGLHEKSGCRRSHCDI